VQSIPKSGNAMAKRKASRVAFTFVVVSAVVITVVGLYSLAAGWAFLQGLWLTLGVLVVIWAIIFSILEVRRIAAREKSIVGPADEVDPDAPRKVIVEPPTGEATPHHEWHAGSEGLDQGQLTSRLTGTPTPREMFQRRGGKKAS
jgi:hypothetical protein